MENNHITDSNVKPDGSKNSEAVLVSKSINDEINEWLKSIKEKIGNCTKCEKSLINSGVFVINNKHYCPDCFNNILRDDNSDFFDDFVD